MNTGRQALAAVILAYVAIDHVFCQFTPRSSQSTILRQAWNLGSRRQQRAWQANQERISRRYEKDLLILRSQMFSLESRLSSLISATINERLTDIVSPPIIQNSELRIITGRLDNVEGELQALQDQPHMTGNAWAGSENVQGVTSRIKTLEEAVEFIRSAVGDKSLTQENSTEYNDIPKHRQSDIYALHTKCEESVENLRKEVYRNISKVSGSSVRQTKPNHDISKRSSPQDRETSLQYNGNDVEHQMIGADLHDDYPVDDNSTLTKRGVNDDAGNRIDGGGDPQSNSETRQILDGINFRLSSHETFLSDLLEMYTNNSLILTGYENRFNTIVTAFNRADRKDTELNGGIRSNRRMLESFAKSFRELVLDSRRQSSAIVQLRKRIRNIEGASPKSFARTTDLQSLRQYVDQTISRLSSNEPSTTQRAMVSNETIKSIVKSTISSLNDSVVRNQEAIDGMKNLRRTVRILESEMASYSSEVESIPELRSDVAGIVAMKNLVLRNSADISKIHQSVTTGEVSLIEFYSKLSSLDKTVQNLQIQASDIAIDTSALHRDISRLNSSALDAAYGFSNFKNIVGHNISQVMYDVKDVSSALTTTDNRVKRVDAKISNLKLDVDNRGTSLQLYKAGVNASFHQVGNRLSQIDYSITQANDMISNTNTRFDEEVDSFNRKTGKNTDLIQDLTGDVGDLRSTLERTREADFRATTERNEIMSRLDVLTANVGNQARSVTTLQGQAESSGLALVTMESRLNSLESVANRFADFEESTNRRLRTELNATREVRQKILEQFSRLESIDTQMNELVNSVHIAQNNIMAQRGDFKSLLDRSANQSQSLRRLTQRLHNDFTGTNVTRELYRKINELHRMIGSVKGEINAFSAKATAQKARFEDIESDVSELQTSDWEHTNRNTRQDDLLKSLASQLDRTKEKGRSMEESLSTTGSQLQQIKQISDRNSEDLSDLRTWRDDMDYTVYFLEKFTNNLINNSRDATIASRRLSTRVSQLESQGQSFAVQVDSVKRIVNSNAAGLAQQYSQVNGLVAKESEFQVSLERVERELSRIDTLQADLTTVSDRTDEMSKSVSRHGTRLASLDAKSSYIYDEVNVTIYRLNELMSHFHDGNRRRYARESELVGSIEDAKSLISRVNSSVSYNRAGILSVTADLSMNKAQIDNVSSDIGQLKRVMATAKDLRNLENRLQKSLNNISGDVEENLQSIQVFRQNLEQASEDIRSARQQDSVQDSLLANLSTSLQAQNGSIRDIVQWKSDITAELSDMLQHRRAFESNFSMYRQDALNTTLDWVETLKEEISSRISEVHLYAQVTDRKMDSGLANLSSSIRDLEANTQQLILGIEENVTILELGVDEKLDGELARLKINQQNLTGAVTSSEFLIDKVQDELNLLKEWKSMKLKESSLAHHFRSEIMKKMTGRLRLEEEEFIEEHVPGNFTSDDVDDSTKTIVRLAMLAIDQDVLLANLTGEIEENTIQIKGNEVRMMQNFSAVQQDITSLSKDLNLCSERLDNSSMHLEKSLNSYSKLSFVKSAVENVTSLVDNKIEILTLRAEQVENSSNNIGENLSELMKLVKDLDAENRQELKNITSLMAHTSNLTQQQMMEVTSRGLDSLNSSLRMKISELEASNVQMQLDSKIVALNTTVSVLTDHLGDITGQFATVADYVRQMQNSSGGLPVANAMLCGKDSPFLRWCRKKYITSMNREVNYVRYRDLFQYLYDETQRLKYVPERIDSVSERTETVSKQQQYFELVVQQYVEDLNSNIANVSDELKEVGNRSRAIDAIHGGRLDGLESQAMMTQYTIDNITENISDLRDAVRPLSVMPEAITELEKDLAYSAEKLEIALNHSITINRNNLDHINKSQHERSNVILSQAKEMYANLQTHMNSLLSSVEDQQTLNYGFFESKLTNQETDIENLVNFRVDLVKALNNIRNAFLPFMTIKDNRTAEEGTNVGMFLTRFIAALQRRMNGTQDALTNIKAALREFSNRISYQDQLLIKINEIEEGFNTSLIANTKSITSLTHQADFQAYKTENALQSALTWFNITKQNVTEKILANRYLIDSLQNELEVDCKRLNDSVLSTFEKITAVESVSIQNDVELRSLLLKSHNESAARSDSIEETLKIEVMKLDKSLKKVSEKEKANNALMQETALSLTSVNFTMEEMQNTIEQRVEGMIQLARNNSAKIAALFQAEMEASIKRQNMLKQLNEIDNAVESLVNWNVNEEVILRKINKSLESLVSANQMHESAVQEMVNNTSLVSTRMADLFQKIESNNKNIVEHSSAIFALQNLSNHQNNQINTHWNEIELLHALSEQSSEHTSTILDMMSAMKKNHVVHQNYLSRHWTEIQRHQRLLGNVTENLDKTIADLGETDDKLSRKIADAFELSSSTASEVKYLNSSYDEMGGYIVLLRLQVKNLTLKSQEMFPRLKENDAKLSAALSRMEDKTLQALNESLVKLHVAYKNISVLAQRDLVESGDFEVLSGIIENQVGRVFELIEDLRNSFNKDLNDAAANSTEVIRMITDRLLEHVDAPFVHDNCSDGVDSNMFETVLSWQNDSIQSLMSKVQGYETRLSENENVVSILRKFDARVVQNMSDIIENIQTSNMTTLYLKSDFERLVLDSQSTISTFDEAIILLKEELSDLKIDNSDLRLQLMNDSIRSSAILQEFRNRTFQTEVKANESNAEIVACKEKINALAERMDGADGHFKNRLQQVENTSHAGQEELYNLIQNMEIGIVSLENATSSCNAKMSDMAQNLHSVIVRVNDTNVKLENVSAVLEVNVPRYGRMLEHLSESTKEMDMKLNLRELAEAELESAIEVLSLNASRRSKAIGDIQQFLNGVARNQRDIQNDIAYLDNTCVTLNKEITNNDERYQQQFSESQTTFEDGMSKIKNGTTHLKAGILEHGKRIQKLEFEHLSLLKRQSEMLNFERDLQQSHVNLSSYVIKSQAQNGQKFLTLLGMTSKISNDTDVNKVGIDRLRDGVQSNKIMLDSIEDNVSVLGDDLFNLSGITASVQKRMDDLSADIDVLQMDMERFNSSMALVIDDNLSKTYRMEEKVISLNQSVGDTAQSLHTLERLLQNITVNYTVMQFDIKGRFADLEALTGLQQSKLNSHAGNLQTLLNRTDSLIQNQKQHSEMIVQNSAQISDGIGTQSGIKRSMIKLYNTTGDNHVQIQSLRLTQSKMKDAFKILNSTQEKTSDEISATNSKMSSELEIIKSSIDATNQDLHLQSEQINNISDDVEALSKTSLDIAANLSDEHAFVEKMARDLRRASEKVENQEMTLTSLNSSYHDNIKDLKENLDHFKSGQRSMSNEFRMFQDKLGSFESAARENFLQLNDSVHKNWESISTLEEQSNEVEERVDNLFENAKTWDVASENLKLAMEDLRLVQENLRDQETQVRLHNSTFSDVFDTMSKSQGAHTQLSRVVHNVKQDIDSLQDSTTRYIANNTRRESLLRAQAEENSRTSLEIGWMKEKLRNLTSDDTDFEEELKNTSNALRVLAARTANQSIALRLISDEIEVQRNQFQKRLDNISISLMQTHAESSVGSNRVRALESKYSRLFDEVVNNTMEIANNKMRDKGVIARIMTLDDSTADISRSLSESDMRSTHFETIMGNRTNELERSVEDLRSNLSYSTKNLENLLRISIQTNSDGIKDLSTVTNELNAKQDAISQRISNLTRHISIRASDAAAKNLAQDLEAEVLKENLGNVVDSMRLIQGVSNDISHNVDEISTSLENAVMEIQNNVATSVQALKSSVSEDIAANKNQIELLSESIQAQGEIDGFFQRLLDNLTDTLKADVAHQWENIADLRNATQIANRQVDHRYSTIYRQVRSNQRDFASLSNQSADLAEEQEKIRSLLSNETERITLLRKALDIALSEVGRNTRNLTRLDERLADLDLTISDRLHNQSVSIELLRDFDETSRINSVDLESHLATLEGRFGSFMNETSHELKDTRRTAAGLVTSLERFINRTLNDAFNQIDALTDAANMATVNVSTNRQYIVSLIGNLSTVSTDMQLVMSRQHQYVDAVRLLRSLQNETEQQVEILSDEMLRLHDRTSRCEIGLERHTANIISQENSLENITVLLDRTRKKVFRQGDELGRTSVELKIQRRGISDLNETIQSLRSFDVEAQRNISTIDAVLKGARNQFEQFVNFSNDLALKSEESLSRLQSNLTAIKEERVSNDKIMQRYNSTLSAMERKIQELGDASLSTRQKMNVSETRIDQTRELLANLSLVQRDIGTDIARNNRTLRQHWESIAEVNSSQSTVLNAVNLLNTSLTQLRIGIDLRMTQNLEEQASKLTSILDQLAAMFNETRRNFGSVEKKLRDNRFDIKRIGDGTDAIATEARSEIGLLRCKMTGLQNFSETLNETVILKYLEMNSRQNSTEEKVSKIANKTLENSLLTSRLHISQDEATSKLTEFMEHSKVLIRGLGDRDKVLVEDMESLKETLRLVRQELALDSSTLAEIQLSLLHQRGLLQETEQKLDAAVTSTNKNLTLLSSVIDGKSARLDSFATMQDSVSSKLNVLVTKLFKFDRQMSGLKSRVTKHAVTLEGQNLRSQGITAELEDIVKKLEFLMMLNLKNDTFVGDESMMLSFAQTLTQLRKDMTTLNISAWNAISVESQDDEYGRDNATMFSSIYVDYPDASVANTKDIQYLLSNFSSVLRDIENSLYFVVPKTSEVIRDLASRQKSLEALNNITHENVSYLRDAITNDLSGKGEMENMCQRHISNLSVEFAGIVGDFVELKQSAASNDERFGRKVKEIDAKILDGSGRLDSLERIVPFMETKLQHTIEMVYGVNKTVNSLQQMQQMRDGQLDLMFADIQSLRQNVRTAEHKVSGAEDAFVRFSNASTRYRISLWNDVLQIINTTVEKVETQAEVLARGGERRDLLLVNSERNVRRLSERVGELQRRSRDTEVLVSAIAQETKWNGGQIDTCLLDVEELEMENDRKFQSLENEIGNQTAAIAKVNSKLDSLANTARTLPPTLPSTKPALDTDETTAVQFAEVESPTNLQTYNIDASSLLLSWDASPTSGVTGYRVTLTNAFDAEAPPIQKNVEDTQLRVEGLYSDMAYNVEIYAEKGIMTSPALTGVAIASTVPSATSTREPEVTPTGSDIIWQCNFERVCALNNTNGDDFDWDMSGSGVTPSEETGPSGDHTLRDGDGHYAFIETSNPRDTGDIARLATSTMESVEDACLEFFYHMYGVGIGDLSVWLVYQNQAKEKIWEKSRNQGDMWQKEVVEVHSEERFHLTFEGVRGSDYHGDIALDDIVLKRGRCPKPLFQCDFEDPNSCGFAQDNTDDFDWTRNKGATPSDFTGPMTDHTLGTPDGYYIYMEASDPHLHNQKARILSPEIRTSVKNCLQFFYHMHGIDVNTLNVYTTRSVTNTPDKLIWSKQGPQGDAWTSARVNIDIEGRYRVVFEAIVGIDYHGDIGLDDVSISTGSCDTPVCSLGHKFGDFCFAIDETPSTYRTASAACKENSGHLATVKTHQQQDFIRDLVANNTKPLSRFWIGLDDLAAEGRFVYADGTPLVLGRNSLQAWSVGEPNDSDGTEDCVAIDIAYKNRGWSGLFCDTEIGFICQYPALP